MFFIYTNTHKSIFHLNKYKYTYNNIIIIKIKSAYVMERLVLLRKRMRHVYLHLHLLRMNAYDGNYAYDETIIFDTKF